MPVSVLKMPERGVPIIRNIKHRKKFINYKYLDKKVTRQFIMNQNWERLNMWVRYNLSKTKY
jgi:hypothetical protein